MKVFCCVLLLVAGLALGSSAPTHEECQELLKVVSMSDRSKLYGKTHFIIGHSNHEIHKAVQRNMNSGTTEIAAADHDVNGVVVTQELKVNGSCIHRVINATIEGDEVVAEVMHVASSRFRMYEVADDAMAVVLNTTYKNPQKFLKMMSLSSDHEGEAELDIHSVYLISKEKTVDDAKKEHFKKQAVCLGIHDEPTFVYDGKTELCGLPQSVEQN
ncbi:uncharacterized protein ACB058_006578 [Synchiropus picturatus]